MDEITLTGLGLVEIEGEEIVGGEAFPWLPIVGAIGGACLVAVANNWGAFKEEFAAGFSAGASGTW